MVLKIKYGNWNRENLKKERSTGRVDIESYFLSKGKETTGMGKSF